MKNGKNCFPLRFVVCAAWMLTLFFSACSTLHKDMSINISQDQMEVSLLELEGMIIPLEADARGRQSDLAPVRRIIGDREKESVSSADYAGRLMAWSGRLAILEGRYSEAQRLYRQSVAVSPGNVPAIILGIRLEGDPAKRLELIERELALNAPHSSLPGYGELHIEKGRALAEMYRFSEAAGSFDTAFAAAMDDVYRETYRAARDRAWDLRNAGDSAAVVTILERDGMSWKDCITLIQSETRLLRFLTGGRDMSETELFAQLFNRSFIPATQDITLDEWPAARPGSGDMVRRGGAAWIIWRLYAESRADRGLLSRYSARYATGTNLRSPIADVPPLSPFFDSILGCVETEFISLPDGRNFKADDPIRAAELLAALKKIEGSF